MFAFMWDNKYYKVNTTVMLQAELATAKTKVSKDFEFSRNELTCNQN